MSFGEFFSNNFAELVGLVFIWIILKKEKILDKEDVRKFLIIFYCECAELIAFNIEKITGYWSEPTVYRILLSGIAYVLRAALVYLFVRLIWPHENSRLAKVILAIPLVVCIIGGFSPFFTDIVYSFSPTNHFARGPLGGVFMAVVIGYVLVFVYYIIRQHNKNEKLNTEILLLIAFFIVMSTIMSTIYDIEWLGRLSIVYGMVFCIFSLDACKLKNMIFVLQENEELKNALHELNIIREKEKIYQKDLLEAKQEAEQANRAKTDFLLRMSHDIRTPLNGIVGMLEVSSRNREDIAKRDDCLGKARESAQVLLELINEVLDMNKLESGKVFLEHVPFDLREIIKSVYTIISRQAEDSGIEIIEENCNCSQHRLVGSPVHYKRIMMNILSNAIKYNKPNGRIYVSWNEISSDDNTVSIEFKCNDTGIGMSKEFVERIFEPFSQENESARSEYGGTGLGMSITQNLISRMGGSITVESEKGVGSCFDVIIPFEIDKTASEISPGKEEEKKISIAGVKVLLVEDNKLNMEIARDILEDEGALVAEALNGRNAADTFRRSQPYEFDLILMDLMMPVMNGLEATRKIRAMGRPEAKEIPIIAMTADAFAEDRITAMEAGMNDYLTKPVDSKVMIEMIARYVNLYRKKLEQDNIL